MRRDTTDMEYSAITAIVDTARRYGIPLKPGDARRLALATVGALTTGEGKHRRRATVTTVLPLTPKAGAGPDDARRIAAQLEAR